MSSESGHRIQVLFVSLDMARGGAQRVTSTLLQHLDRHRFRPSLCCLKVGADFDVPGDVPNHVLGFRGPSSTPWAALRLRRLISSERPDVIVSNVNATNLLTAIAVRSTEFEPRWIARVGSDPVHHDRGLRKVLLRALYGRAAKVVVNARALEPRIAETYSLAPARIATIANPTDFSWLERCAMQPVNSFTISEDRKNLVAIGRLFQVKRYDLMLRAVAEINGAIPVHLHVFGDGPLESDLKRLARELGIHEIVSWHGFQLNPFPVVSRADLVLLTSDYEGLPNALIEAQGLGVPAVSTACPTGPDEIIEDGVTGLLVAVGDSSAIAEAATRILGDEGRRRTMASAARLRMHRLFEAETVTRQWEFLFVDTLPRREDR